MADASKVSNWTISERPRALSDLYGLDNIKKYFYTAAKKGSFPKATLLRGQFGNGKTTTAQIVASMIVCQNPAENGDPCNACPSCKAIVEERWDRDVISIDGGQSGKSDLVDTLTEFLSTAPMYDKKKVIIIEEIQELSTAAKNSLLKLLEQPQDWVHFILLSMESSGLSGFASRCVPFNFKPLDVRTVMFFLKAAMEKQGYWEDTNIPDEFKVRGLGTIAQTCGGSLRQALQILQLCITCGYFTAQEIEDNTGFIDSETITQILIKIAECDNSAWESLNAYDPMAFFALAIKIVSDAAIFRASQTLPDGDNPFFLGQASKMAATPHFDQLIVLMEEIAKISRPFLRKSEMYLKIAEYYKLNKAQPAVNPVPTAPVRTRQIAGAV